MIASFGLVIPAVVIGILLMLDHWARKSDENESQK